MQSLVSARVQTWLIWFLRGLISIGLVILLGKSFELQVIKGDYYRSLSEENRIRRVVIQAPRGKILARGGEVLVANKEVRKRIVFNSQSGYEKLDASDDAHEDEIITEWQRDYLYKEKLAHLSGYLGEVSRDELGKVDPSCVEKGPFLIGDLVGRGGLEEVYNCILSGVNGEELIEVDTQGKKVRVLGVKKPLPGKDIKTTIDISLQERVADLFEDKSGGIIVTDTQGEVLALYSSPSFDPNLFLKKNNTREVENTLHREDTPLFNRVISGLYHPGSTFKPVVAMAGLEEGKIDKDFVFEDTGEIVLKTLYGTFSYTNWYFTQYGGKEGSIDLTRAIARSTDTFFYKVGEMAGVDALVEWSRKFGLDRKSGIDLPGEVAGLIPSPDWKLKAKNEKWFLGNTYHMSIGQGDVALSPILINSLISAISTEGKLCQPKVVGESNCQQIEGERENYLMVKEGMVQACSEGGTGYTFFDAKLKVGCKTGTAETVEKDITHAWFTFFAPAKNENEKTEFPEIVVTVFVEKGGEGSKDAGPIAREIYNYWFSQHKR